MDCDEVADDIDTQFLNSFSMLGCNEHEDLIHKFQGLANDLNYNTGKFFLEMNSWNLQAAVGCYFDFLATSSQNNVPMASMRIVRETSVGFGQAVTRDTPFKQSWLLENNGQVNWPEGCYLKLVSELNDDGKMPVQAIGPRETTTISINLVSPPETGQFRTQFSLCSPTGSPFGPIIWSVVDVSDGGTLALTQQLAMLDTSNGSTSTAQQMNFTAPSNSCSALVPSYSNHNPFGSNAAPTVQNNPNLQNPQNTVLDDGEMESDDRVLL